MGTPQIPSVDSDTGLLPEKVRSGLRSEFAPVVIYAGGAYPPRPANSASVQYIGPVQPTTWLPNDTWVDNS